MDNKNNQSRRVVKKRNVRLKRRRKRVVLLLSLFMIIFIAISFNELLTKGRDQLIEKDRTHSNTEDNSWQLILVNGENPLPDDYQVRLAKVQGKHYTDERIADFAKNMISAAKTDGVDLLICSSYRSAARQEELFNSEVNKYIAAGSSYDEALSQTALSVAVPGHSEHSTGLALDIVTSGYQLLDKGFEETDAFKWLKTNAHKYGFILRYPNDKTDITRITYEPWHYRFVGMDNAKAIEAAGITLEEFLDSK